MNCYLGIDLGTSSVKVILMQVDGVILRTVSESYPIEYPAPGWSQQNPADWWNAVRKAVKKITGDTEKNEIRGISFGGQMHGLVVLDKKDQVIRPAILWNDTRSREETEYLNQRVSTKRLISLTGNIAYAGFTAPKLMWMKKNEPELFERIDKIMLPKDYLAYCFCKIHCTDYSDASGSLILDVEHKCWSKEMMDLLEIEKHQLPKLYESSEVVGTILPAIARELQMDPTTKIIAGAGDNAAAAIGTGTTEDGACTISIGTSGTVFIASNHFVSDRNHTLHMFAHANGKYHLLGCILSAASCNKWWMEEILKTNHFKEEQDSVRELGKNHVFFLPYLMGERSPHNDSEARGTFTGLTMDTKREDMTQAVLEGVAFALRDVLEAAKTLGIEVKEAKLCGGGTKSILWRKILAAVLNITLVIPESEEGPSLGAAMLAAVGCGEYSTVEQAGKKIVRELKKIEPEEELSQRYEVCYKKYHSIYPVMQKLFQTLSE